MLRTTLVKFILRIYPYDTVRSLGHDWAEKAECII